MKSDATLKNFLESRDPGYSAALPKAGKRQEGAALALITIRLFILKASLMHLKIWGLLRL